MVEDFFPTLLDVAGGEKHSLNDQVDGQRFYTSFFSKIPNNKQRLFGMFPINGPKMMAQALIFLVQPVREIGKSSEA